MLRLEFRSKLLWSKQRIDQVGGEADGDNEGDEGITHGAPSQSFTKRSIGRHQGEAAEPEAEKDEIEHGSMSPVR